jgi:ABC-type amino acid transport substrate-binding protein
MTQRSPTHRIMILALTWPLLGVMPACGGDQDGEVTERISPHPARPVVTPSFAEAREAGNARLAFFHAPSTGFAHREPGGHPTGVTAELLRDFARYVADEHGLRVDVEWIQEERWADFYRYVRDSEGGVFGIGNVTITDERRRELSFSPPYMSNIAVLVTHQDVPELTSMDEIGEAFRGLTALPYPGTLHETRLAAIRERHLPDVRTRHVASNDELVALLASGDGYFGYIDIYNYWQAREAGAPLRHHPVGDDDSEAFGVIMPRGTDWAPVMDAFFAADGGYVESERFRSLLREHLGEGLAARLTRE